MAVLSILIKFIYCTGYSSKYHARVNWKHEVDKYKYMKKMFEICQLEMSTNKKEYIYNI